MPNYPGPGWFRLKQRDKTVFLLTCLKFFSFNSVSDYVHKLVTCHFSITAHVTNLSRSIVLYVVDGTGSVQLSHQTVNSCLSTTKRKLSKTVFVAESL